MKNKIAEWKTKIAELNITYDKHARKISNQDLDCYYWILKRY